MKTGIKASWLNNNGKISKNNGSLSVGTKNTVKFK